MGLLKWVECVPGFYIKNVYRKKKYGTRKQYINRLNTERSNITFK